MNVQSELLNQEIENQLSQVERLKPYYQLILIVASPRKFQTAVWKNVSQTLGYQYINVNLELSRCLLELSPRKRSLKVYRILETIVGKNTKIPILLAHLEILFDTSLKINPLRCLQQLSRRQTLLAVWPGRMVNHALIYAEPDHPEYFCTPIGECLIVDAQEIL